jgi:SAM-dependent methyltransferase
VSEGWLEGNRALWDEWADLHAGSAFYDVEGFKRGGVRLAAYEIEEVGDVSGADLLHLQCHFGIDTLSWARLGARVTGVDFSPCAIALARALAAEVGIDVRFVEASIDELPTRLDGRFDVVYTSRGVLGWLRDLDASARTIAHFLQPGGVFYVTEIHPVAQVFDDAPGVRELRLRYPYFPRAEPLVLPVHGSYAESHADVSATTEYGWVHSLGEIISAVCDAGLRVELLHELPFCDWELPFLDRAADGTWRLPAGQEGELPLFFSLRAVQALRTR